MNEVIYDTILALFLLSSVQHHLNLFNLKQILYKHSRKQHIELSLTLYKRYTSLISKVCKHKKSTYCPCGLTYHIAKSGKIYYLYLIPYWIFCIAFKFKGLKLNCIPNVWMLRYYISEKNRTRNNFYEKSLRIMKMKISSFPFARGLCNIQSWE